MPELPEVETVKNTLAILVTGKKISHVDVLYKNTIENDVDEFSNGLKGTEILSFSRVGKFIIFHLSNNLVLVSHLRMEGKYFLKDEKEALTKHDLVAFHFDDETKLIYNDTRKFGKIKLLKEESYMNEAPLNKVGPDPFMIKDDYFLYEHLRKKSLPIKTTLLDQAIMSGLGNIYVDEVLFDTKIHPLTKAKDITKEEAKALLLSSRKILAKAIELGGSTIKSYHPQEGVSGEFQINLQVYGHKDGACVRCGHHLRKIFVNGRGTTFCPNCQKRVGAPFVIGLTGKTASGKTTASNYLAKKANLYLSADTVVDLLYEDKEVLQLIDRKFPQILKGGKVDKLLLRENLTNDKKFKKRFEAFIHPLVFDYMEKEINRFSSKDLVVIEVPLLFETHFEDLCDVTILLTTSRANQEERISSRGVDPDKAIKLNSNFKEAENEKKAAFVICNDKDIPSLYNELDVIYDKVRHH